MSAEEDEAKRKLTEATDNEEANSKVTKGLRRFQDFMPAFLLVGGLSIVLVAILLAMNFFSWGPFREGASLRRLVSGEQGERLLFISYFLVLFSMWAVYFMTSFEWVGIKTLRKLLKLTSNIYQRNTLPSESLPNDKLASLLREKARTSITMLSMLTAGATLLLTRSLDLVYVLPEPHLWQVVLGYGAAAAAVMAAICFVVSADSFDVMYNVFGADNSAQRLHMLQFFYNSTRNTRYYGVMFLLWSLCLFAGTRSPLFGALVIGLVVSVGWSHWFPSPPPVGAELKSKSVSIPIGLRATFIVLPVCWPFLPTSFFLPIG